VFAAGACVFLYSRAEWTLVPANYVRWITALGLGPGTRLATIGPANPLHLANRAFADLGTPEPSEAAARPGEATALRLTVAMPIGDMVTALNAYQPDICVMPPSAATRLADEQAAGRLAIRPRTILADRSPTAQPSRLAAPPASALAMPLSTAEVLTDAGRARFRAAWGADLYDTYMMTETGLIGAECPQRGGIHISEDLVIVESVDERHQPVPHGTAGAKVLITNLTNYAQPLIRYEVPDRIAVSPDICRCGRPFMTIARIEPRETPGDRRRDYRREHRGDHRGDGQPGGDYGDTPTMALGDMPTVLGSVATTSLRLVSKTTRQES
jgi:phenylacetate-CoA ligase